VSELELGIERAGEFEVDGPLLTDVGGTLAAQVLAQEHLPEGRATVGFEICVKHVGAAARGARCTVHARLREVVDGRKLRFDVEVREGERTIGVGTHERRVIDATAFGG
jgi:predicted thioesterase